MPVGEKIVELFEFIEDKHNVHQTIKNMVIAIGVLPNRRRKRKKEKGKKST